jgi:hypothetical protein
VWLFVKLRIFEIQAIYSHALLINKALCFVVCRNTADFLFLQYILPDINQIGHYPLTIHQ